MNNQSGFTMVELIMVMVLLGIVSAMAVMKSIAPGQLTMASQAQKMASDLRHAQTLAYTRGQRTLVTINAGTNGSYDVTCITVSTPCSTSTDFSGTITGNVVLAGTNLSFNSLGQPSNALGEPLVSDASFTLCYPSNASCTSRETITTAALTGNVTVTP